MSKKITQVRITDSSCIERVAYNTHKRALTILFHNGRLYQYVGVGSTTFRDFINSKSKGNFYNNYIRDVYESQEAAA